MGDTNRIQISTSDNSLRLGYGKSTISQEQTEREKHLMTRIDALAYWVGFYEGLLHVVALREDVPEDIRKEAKAAIGEKDAG